MPFYMGEVLIDGIDVGMGGTFQEQIDALESENVQLQESVDTLTEEKSSLESEVSTLEGEITEGKSLVANAITEKGVTTASDATFQVMANNILSIPEGEITGLSYKISFRASFTKSGVTQLTCPKEIKFAICGSNDGYYQQYYIKGAGWCCSSDYSPDVNPYPMLKNITSLSDLTTTPTAPSGSGTGSYWTVSSDGKSLVSKLHSESTSTSVNSSGTSIYAFY